MKFLHGGVVVEVSTIPEAVDGQPQVMKIPLPALTLCAFTKTGWVTLSNAQEHRQVDHTEGKEEDKEDVGWLLVPLVLLR